jgi:hypothetical protein
MIKASKNDLYEIKKLQDEVRKSTESSENKEEKLTGIQLSPSEQIRSQECFL